MIINWQNKKHRIVILSLAAILLLAFIFFLLNFVLSRSDKPITQIVKPQNKAQKSDPPPAEILGWRAKEQARLVKASHDEALFKEIIAKKDSARCGEMQGLDGEAFCLIELARQFQDLTLCDHLKEDEFRLACQEQLNKKPAISTNSEVKEMPLNKLINNK